MATLLGHRAVESGRGGVGGGGGGGGRVGVSFGETDSDLFWSAGHVLELYSRKGKLTWHLLDNPTPASSRK